MLKFSSVLPTPKIASHIQNFLKWFFAFASFVLAGIHRPDHVCRLSRQLCNIMMQNCRRDQLAVERDQMDIPRETFILGQFASIMLWHFFPPTLLNPNVHQINFVAKFMLDMKLLILLLRIIQLRIMTLYIYK